MGYFYLLRQDDMKSINKNNHSDRKIFKSKFLGNEIFFCSTLFILLFISTVGNILIRNRTKQQLIYNSIPQLSTNSLRK